MMACTEGEQRIPAKTVEMRYLLVWKTHYI